MPSPEALLAQPRQRLDMAAQRLPASVGSGLDRRRVALARLGQRLEARSPRTELARRHGQVESLGLRLDALFKARVQKARTDAARDRDRLEALSKRLSLAFVAANRRRADRLAGLGQLLGSLSYKGVLARGYALVTDDQGRPVRSRSEAAPGASLTIEFRDGTIGATVAGARPPPRPRGSAPPQDDLFG